MAVMQQKWKPLGREKHITKLNVKLNGKISLPTIHWKSNENYYLRITMVILTIIMDTLTETMIVKTFTI